jgi:ABC-type multidrug transport system fused ATPase/permease subunit
MNSVERVREYIEKVDQEETPEQLEASNAFAESLLKGGAWPSAGAVSAEDVSMSYRAGPLVLKNISFAVEGKEKCGICGRTGSGKSSLIAALFRMEKLQSGTIRCVSL